MNKDEIIAWAREAGFFLSDKGYGPDVLHTDRLEYSSRCFERFATLCRADLVEEIRTLKADAENFAPTIRIVDKLQLERDALRAEVDRLKSERIKHHNEYLATHAALQFVKEERDAARAEAMRLTEKCKLFDASAYKAKIEAQTLVEAAEAERDALRAELSALRAGSGEAVALGKGPVPWNCVDGSACKHGWWCSETYCQEKCEFRSTPQPSVGPVVTHPQMLSDILKDTL